MRKFIIFIVMLVFAQDIFAQGSGSMFIGGAMSDFDTLTHRRIGPGMTYTKVYFEYAGQDRRRMLMNVIEIDMTNPYNSHTSYMANDRFYESNDQLEEFNRQKKEGKKPVATVMGGAFVDSHSSELRPLYEVGGGLVSDGRLLLDPTGLAYYVDSSNKAACGNLALDVTVQSASGSFKISNVNRVRGRSTGVTLFCNNYAKSRDADNSTGSEVLLSLIGSDKVGTNGVYQCKVVQKMSGSGHEFSSNQVILSANGDAESYLAGLNVGDEVSLNVSCIDALGQAVSVMQSSTPLFGYGVVEGKAQPSTMSNYAQCAFGVSKDGNTAYWFDLENNGMSSAPVSMMNEYMVYAGAWNAVLMDGGPSAEMVVQGKWATTTSLGGGYNGRYVPCGLIAYSTAPADDNIVSADFKAVRMSANKNVVCTPELYGFNKYGELISEDAGAASNDIYLECDESFGKITDDGKSFIAVSGNSGFVYVRSKTSDVVGKMWVDVQAAYSIRVEPKLLFTETGRGCNAALYEVQVDGSEERVDAGRAKWTTTDRWICDVDEGGYLYPKEENEGEDAFVICEYLGMKDTIRVVVENQPADDEVFLTSLVDNLDDIGVVLPSIPTSFFVKVAVESGSPSDISIIYKKGEQQCEEKLKADENSESSVSVIVPLDNTEIADYPVTIERISYGDAKVRLETLSALYRKATPSGIVNVPEADGFTVYRAGDDIMLGLSGSVAGSAVGYELWSLKGERLAGYTTVHAAEGAVAVGKVRAGGVMVVVHAAGKKYVYKIV